MKGSLVFLAALTVLLLAPLAFRPAHATGLVDHVYLGVNGAWLDGPGTAWPADVEAGGSASASLSPHISLTADTFYGFSHSYLRWDGGACATVSDVDNPNLSMALGISYRGGSTHAVGPNEWAPYVSVGWKPNPAKWPNFSLGGRGSLGLTSNRTLVTLGGRYALPLK